MGPRIHDMELKDIVDILLKIRAGAYSLEAANPVTSTSGKSGKPRSCRTARS
jgi:hypothetical protein